MVETRMAENTASSALPDFAALAAAFNEMQAPRLAFQQFFDGYLATLPTQMASGKPGPARPQSFLHAVFIGHSAMAARGVTSDPALTAHAAALAILALGAPDQMLHAIACAVAAGLFDPPPGSVANIEQKPTHSMRLLWAAFGKDDGMAQLPQAELQKLTSRDAKFNDPDLIYPAILLAKQRLCRVETMDASGNSVTGTGFLIGPSAVLTNWHVVSGIPNPRNAEPLKVHFDFKPSSGIQAEESSIYEARKEWLLDWSDTGPVSPPGAAEGWWMDAAKRKAWHDGHAGSLDFAVIMLKGAPGLQRGWYQLGATLTVQPSDDCFVFHHPLGNSRSYNSGKFQFDSPQQFRAFHSASTAKGSSGGLLLDSQGRPVALHYLGLGRDPWAPGPSPQVPGDVVNVAIPLAAIAGKLADKLTDIERIEGPVLDRRSLRDGRPVFGRTKLIDALGALARGDQRVLWVQPPEGDFKRPGKSFTVEILQSVFPSPSNLYVKFDADKIKSGEKAMAALILRQLSERAADELPDPMTTENAYDQILVTKVREIIADRWPNSTIWLIIDDLDVHDLTDAGGRRFLNALYARVGDIPQLRIVLIGLQVSLYSIPKATLLKTDIARSDLENVAPLFLDWLLERGTRNMPIDKRVMELIANTLKSFAGSEVPMETLGKFTAAHFGPALKTYLQES